MDRAPAARAASEKKSLHAAEQETERVQQARHAFGQAVASLAPTRLIFVDEAGVNRAMTRRYGRAPKGERVVGAVPQNYGPNITLVGALGLDGVRAAMSLEGAMDGAAFRVFVEQVLAPTLSAGDVVVLDNLKCHYVQGVREAIEQRQAQLLYLPPYSPDLSPIEQCWSKVKEFLRSVGARTQEALDGAVDVALGRITGTDAHGWFQFCGYPVQTT